MTWKDVGQAVAGAAPVLGTVLAGPAGGAVGSIVASLFGTAAKPDQVAQAIAADPQAMVKLRELELTHAADLRRMVLEAETAHLAEINRTMREEAKSADRFVRWMRPAFGYSVMWQCNALVLAFGVALFVKPGALASIALVIEHVLEVILLELAVLGVYVYQRSRVDKPLAAGLPPATGVLGGLLGQVLRREPPPAAPAPAPAAGNPASGGR